MSHIRELEQALARAGHMLAGALPDDAEEQVRAILRDDTLNDHVKPAAIVDRVRSWLNVTALRTWRKGDPEPVDCTTVIDRDGDRWGRIGDGRWICTGIGVDIPWDELARIGSPLTELRP